MGFKAIACDMRKTYVGRFTGMPSRCSCCLKPKGSPRIHLQNQIQFIFPSSEDPRPLDLGKINLVSPHQCVHHLLFNANLIWCSDSCLFQLLGLVWECFYRKH
ncbi:unnamed protein product [Prunus armeniaca]